MDIKNYAERKAKGHIQIIRARDAFAVVSKKYDPDTGESVAPHIEAIDLKDLAAKRQELQDMIAALDAIEADVKGLP